MTATKGTTIRIPKDVRERIDAYCRQQHCSLSQALVMWAITGLEVHDNRRTKP